LTASLNYRYALNKHLLLVYAGRYRRKLMTVPQIYCTHCGAACDTTLITCFACQSPLEKVAERDESARTLLAGRYLLLERVGQGGFGSVYKALDCLENQQPVAIKAIALEGLNAQQRIEATDSFNREVMMLTGLSHPHLPRLCQHFADSEHWYLVMDFIEGQTLETYLFTRQKLYQPDEGQTKRLPLDEVLDIALQLCDMLDYLHTRQPTIIFRDLKPSNIMRTATGHLYLIDFGIARCFQPGRARDTLPLGSLGYAAPEQYGRAQTTPRADIYSLGALLHQLLTGKDPADHPFHFAPFSELPPQWAALGTLITAMLEREPDKRPESVRKIKQELQLLASRNHARLSLHAGLLVASTSQTSSTQAPILQVPTPPPGTRKGISRRTMILGISALGVASTVGAVGLLSTSSLRQAPHQAPIIVSTPSHGSYGEEMQPGDISALAWSPDSKLIASVGDDNTVNVWDVVTKKTLFTYTESMSVLAAITWSPDGNALAWGTDDGMYCVWDMAKGHVRYREVYTTADHNEELFALSWSPNGQRIALATNMSGMQIRDASNGKLLVRDGNASTASVSCIAWSPDSKRIVAGYSGGSATVYDASNGKTDLVYKKQASQFFWQEYNDIESIAWSPDGKWIASGASSKKIQVWSPSSGDLCLEYTEHEADGDKMVKLGWSPDGENIASSAGTVIRVWDATSGTTRVIYRSQQEILTLAWSPDGKMIASGGYEDHEGLVYLWSF
jgi:serine/threonine protein kinase